MTISSAWVATAAIGWAGARNEQTSKPGRVHAPASIVS